MHSTQREFIAIFAIATLVFVCALAWAIPVLSSGASDNPQYAQQLPVQSQSKSGTFTGTILRNGDAFVLHDSSGATFGLDDPQRARPFEGKLVKVTGQLNEQSRVIHVVSIEFAS
jgi:hypothetical protein